MSKNEMIIHLLPTAKGYDPNTAHLWTRIYFQEWLTLPDKDEDTVDDWFRDNYGITVHRNMNSVITSFLVNERAATYLILRHAPH